MAAVTRRGERRGGVLGALLRLDVPNVPNGAARELDAEDVGDEAPRVHLAGGGVDAHGHGRDAAHVRDAEAPVRQHVDEHVAAAILLLKHVVLARELHKTRHRVAADLRQRLLVQDAQHLHPRRGVGSLHPSCSHAWAPALRTLRQGHSMTGVKQLARRGCELRLCRPQMHTACRSQSASVSPQLLAECYTQGCSNTRVGPQPSRRRARGGARHHQRTRTKRACMAGHRRRARGGAERAVCGGPHLVERLRLGELVLIQALHEVLPGVLHDLARERDTGDGGVRALVEVEGALIAQLMRDLGLALLERPRRVDHRERHQALQLGQRRVVLPEDAVSQAALVRRLVGAPLLSAHPRPWLPLMAGGGRATVGHRSRAHSICEEHRILCLWHARHYKQARDRQHTPTANPQTHGERARGAYGAAAGSERPHA